MFEFGGVKNYELTVVQAASLLGEVALPESATSDDRFKQRDDFKKRIDAVLKAADAKIEVGVYLDGYFVDGKADFENFKTILRKIQNANNDIAHAAFNKFCDEVNGNKFDGFARRMFCAGWSARALKD